MIKEAIYKLINHKDLTYEESLAVMGEMMDGTATQAQMGGFLTALRMQGETIDEITAFATVMREKGVKLHPERDVMEIVGTGGDEVGTSTFPQLLLSLLPLPEFRLQSTETAVFPAEAELPMYLKTLVQKWI